jgi:putative flippase GtrA
MMNPKDKNSVLLFTAVGLSATVTHLLVVFILVHSYAFPPLFANIIAFLVAFQISFIGHKYLTFSGLFTERSLQLPHYFAVAMSAGIMNEFLYYLFLRFTHLNYFISLIIVIGLVAVYTYILSRNWACR